METTIVMFPAPAVGHMVSMIELSKRLLHHHQHLSVIVLLSRSPSSSSAEATHPASAPRLNFIELPYVEPPAGQPMKLEELLAIYVDKHKAVVADALSFILTDNTVSAFIVDMFCNTMIDVAAELGVKVYVFFTTNAFGLNLALHLPAVDHKYKGEFMDYKEGIEVPAMARVPPLDMPSPLQNKQKPIYTWFLNSSREFLKAQGILVNTFNDLEPKALQALTQGPYPGCQTMPPIYPVGPLLELDKQTEFADHPCLKWLDTQPDSSVVFLCFGSMGTFSAQQAREIAAGLELSGHRFLWSFRVQSSSGEEVLPDGFVGRTNGRGLVWSEWAPQIAILAHRAVGGFVTHCGWNSVLESLWFGVPMIGWPLYAEQRLNAFLLATELEMCLRATKEEDEDGTPVGAEVVERVVRRLMEGEDGKKVRMKAKTIGDLGRKAVEEGGSSYANLSSLVDQWTSKTPLRQS